MPSHIVEGMAAKYYLKRFGRDKYNSTSYSGGHPTLQAYNTAPHAGTY